MKKRYAAIIMAVTAVLVLNACNDTDNSSSKPTENISSSAD